MATWTNTTKNSTTFQNNGKVGAAFWDDAVFAWDDAFAYWDIGLSQYTNQTKNSTTFTNVNKS